MPARFTTWVGCSCFNSSFTIRVSVRSSRYSPYLGVRAVAMIREWAPKCLFRLTNRCWPTNPLAPINNMRCGCSTIKGRYWLSVGSDQGPSFSPSSPATCFFIPSGTKRDYLCLLAFSSRHSKRVSCSVFASAKACTHALSFLVKKSFSDRPSGHFGSCLHVRRRMRVRRHMRFGKPSTHSSIKLLRTASRRGETMKLATVRSPVVMMTSAGIPGVRRPLISSGISASSTSIRAK